jgi:hypothetical protein
MSGSASVKCAATNACGTRASRCESANNSRDVDDADADAADAAAEEDNADGDGDSNDTDDVDVGDGVLSSTRFNKAGKQM